MSEYLTRKQIDAVEDLDRETVEVPEWGGKVLLRELTSGERGAIDAQSIVAKGQKPEFRVESLKTMRERTVAAALIDENGKRLYSDKEIGILARKNGEVVSRLFQKVQDMSGMGEQAVADAEKNSEPTPSDSGDSTS